MNAQEQVMKLNAGWYNVVAQALNLDPSTFQLAQGTLGLQTTDSSGLFRMADATPPPSAVHFYDAGGGTKRSDSFGLLLSSLLPEGGSDLKSALGDDYASWQAYFKENRGQGKRYDALFEEWANDFLDPATRRDAIAAAKKANSAPLLKAQNAFEDDAAKQSFGDSSLYKYPISIDDAQKQINRGSPATISYDSNTAETALKNTMAGGSASGMYDIFSASVSGTFEKLNTTAASSQFKIDGTIKKTATLAVNSPDWLNTAELTRAFGGNGNAAVFDPDSDSDWETFFGESGSLARRISQIVLVSGYDITVTSMAKYSEEDVQRIKAEAKLGVWPFFSASGSFSQEVHHMRNEDGTLSVMHHLDEGLIQIWGVTVQVAPN